MLVLVRMKSALVASLALLACAAFAQAHELKGRAIAVSDGDSITVMDVRRQTFKVRLSGIDAPELGQAFGLAAKRSLSTLLYGEDVAVSWHKVDRYGRLVGVVRLAQSNLDAGLRQLENGMAWFYTAYKHELPAELQRSYLDAETRAKSEALGLWGQPAPKAPWAYRQARTSSAAPSPLP